MATRTLIIDLSKGTGGEPMYGMVTVQRARATSKGTFEVLPWETKLKLFNGIATITEAVTDGSGPFYDSAYLIRVQNGYCAPRWGFMAALPDGTTPISTGDMPKVNPITGEGIYMDAQEWNTLYGTLPDRVDNLEVDVEALKVLGGLTPGDVSDATVASLLTNTTTQSSGALTGVIEGLAVLKDSQVYDALDHGVKGDGVTDDTVALQDLLTEVETLGGGTVLLPKTPNSYKISDTLLIPVNTRVMGSNKKTLIWGNFNKPLFAGKLNGGLRIDNLELSNLELVRQGTAKTTPIVDWTGVSHSEIKNVMIRQAVEPAMSTGLLLGAYSYYNRFEGVQIRGCELGVRLIDAANGNIFAGGVSILFGVRGYHISNSNSNYFTGASAERLEGYGVLLDEGSKQNVFVGCRIEYVAEFAFKIAYSANPAFSNYFFGNAMYLGTGVQRYVSQTDNVVVDNTKGYVFSTLEHSLQRNYAYYYKSATQGVPAGGEYAQINFETKVTDRKDEFNGQTFTAKTAGVYTITGEIRATASSTTEELIFYMRKNSGEYISLGREVIGTFRAIGKTRKIELAVGDTLSFYTKTPNVAYNIVGSINISWIQIMRDA